MNFYQSLSLSEKLYVFGLARPDVFFGATGLALSESLIMNSSEESAAFYKSQAMNYTVLVHYTSKKETEETPECHPKPL